MEQKPPFKNLTGDQFAKLSVPERLAYIERDLRQKFEETRAQAAKLSETSKPGTS